MRVISTKLLALAIFCGLYSLLMGCTGNNVTAGRDARPPGEIEDAGRLPALPGETELPVAVPYEIPSPSSLPVPDGVEAEVWQQLTSELEKQLVSLRGASRVGGELLLRSASTPPTRQLSQTMLSATETELRWGYYSNGDYDQNGEVNVADLTPLAIHFQETAWPFKFVESTVQAVIDGDGNGEINLADVTPIALNFQNNVAKYNIYRSQNPAEYPTEPDAGNGSASLIGSMLLSSATGTPNALRLQFASVRPDALRDDYFWVRPVDNEDTEGIASNRLGPLSDTFTLDGHVYMAGGGTDPLPGVPVELTENGEVVATDVTDFNGYYSFELPYGDYTVTPTGDPFGYSPEFIEATITNEDIYLAPIYPAPVDIFHRWALSDGNGGGSPAGDMKMDADGNVFIATQDWNFFEESDRHYLLKYDIFGELLWSQVFDTPYSVGNSFLQLLPAGDIYVFGQYSNLEGSDPKNGDIFAMRLDSLGNIIWDLAFNYSPIDQTEHHDTGAWGIVDAEENLVFFAHSSDGEGSAGNPGESYDYQLTISPTGELIGQARINTTSPENFGVEIVPLAFDQAGGLLAGGRLYDEFGFTQAVLVQFDQNGNVDWVNNWGNANSWSNAITVGLDGSIFQLFNGQHPGILGDEGIQLAKYGQNGARDWEIYCNAVPSLQREFLTVGPQGKLWVAGQVQEDSGAGLVDFPYIWSFQPGDGALRFARKWSGGAGEVEPMTVFQTYGLALNRYGVAVVAGATIEETGVWGEHVFTVEDTAWEITHGNGFTFAAETPAAKREFPAVQVPDVGLVDPPKDLYFKSYIMLYRP